MSPDKIIAVDTEKGVKYHLINELMLVEEDLDDGHIESVCLSERDADTLFKRCNVSPEELRRLMYEYSAYA